MPAGPPAKNVSLPPQSVPLNCDANGADVALPVSVTGSTKVPLVDTLNEVGVPSPVVFNSTTMGNADDVEVDTTLPATR